MKITKDVLRQLIKEELAGILNEEPSPEEAMKNPTYNLAIHKITSNVKDALKFSDVVFAGIQSAQHITGDPHDFIVQFEEEG